MGDGGFGTVSLGGLDCGTSGNYCKPVPKEVEKTTKNHLDSLNVGRIRTRIGSNARKAGEESVWDSLSRDRDKTAWQPRLGCFRWGDKLGNLFPPVGFHVGALATAVAVVSDVSRRYFRSTFCIADMADATPVFRVQHRGKIFTPFEETL